MDYLHNLSFYNLFKKYLSNIFKNIILSDESTSDVEYVNKLFGFIVYLIKIWMEYRKNGPI